MRRNGTAIAAAIAGLGTFALVATPTHAASGVAAGFTQPSVELAHMTEPQGGGPGMAAPGYGMGHDYGYGPGSGYGMQPFYGMGHGMMGHGMMGHGMMGHGMMGRGMMGHGMAAPEMMGPGYGYGPGYGREPAAAPDNDLSADDIRNRLERSLSWDGNKRLKVGEVKETDDDTIVADIVTLDGSLVQRFKVDRHTGQMQQVD